MEDFSSNSLFDFDDGWVVDRPGEDDGAVYQSPPGGATMPSADIAVREVAVAEQVLGDGDKAAGEVAEGELEEVAAAEEVVPKKRRRKTGMRMAAERSEVPTPTPTPTTEAIQRRSRGRQRHAGGAEVSPFGIVKDRLTAYIFTVDIGEDVLSQILSFSKFGPQAICIILSATGIVSSVTISQTSHPGEFSSFEGRFEILSLSGSFIAGEIICGHEDGGMLNILLGDSEGRVFGGGLAGSLIAATPIQLVCGGLTKQTHREPKRRRCAKSLAVAKPGKLEAERALLTIAEPADGDKNSMTMASAVSELTKGAGDATLVGLNENTSQSSCSVLYQKTSTDS